MNHHTRITILLSALALSIQSFAQSTDAYRASIDSWHRARTENLKKENGWLNLAGLFWLQEGSNSFGSDSTQAVVFPKGSIPAHAGYFVRKGNTVSLLTQPGVRITDHLKEPYANTGVLIESGWKMMRSVTTVSCMVILT
ncbi:MAG: hypothetical protein U9R46_14235, partial [Bacteroidota bacterium]|nr:hypothetical protein [Bacteroidota bacterium]